MKKILGYILFTISIAFLLTSCNKDDVNFDNVNVDNYILGTWHSHRIAGYWNNQTVEGEITKTNEFSDCYREITFKKDGQYISSGYIQGGYGMTTWQTSEGFYTVNGKTISVYDKDEMAQLFFENGELFLRSSAQYDGSMMTMFIYFCK